MGSLAQRLAVAAATLTIAGCGGGGGAPEVPVVAPARTFGLAGFQPAGDAHARRPTAVSFAIRQPSGRPLTDFATGSGPHTGVHLLYVRDDLATITHHHPPVGAGGKIVDRVTFPAPGRYRVVVDAYPGKSIPQRNFQLFRWLTVAGSADKQPLPPYRGSLVVGGYRVTIQGTPKLEAVTAAFLTIDVTDSHGRPATFTTYYGALAHAIFFRAGSLDYFHTHVCAPGATGCTSTLGGAQVTGTSATPGELRVGVLVPVPGTWRLFLQFKVRGRVLTAPFTLTVR